MNDSPIVFGDLSAYVLRQHLSVKYLGAKEVSPGVFHAVIKINGQQCTIEWDFDHPPHSTEVFEIFRESLHSEGYEIR